MNEPVDANVVIDLLAQRITSLVYELAVKDARLAALTTELAALKGEPIAKDGDG